MTEIDAVARNARAVDRDDEPLTLPYDRLVLATGSRTSRTPVRVRGAEDIHDLGTLGAAAT
ncbi:hypothetical protein [Streptomyces sp. NPDC058374]